MIDQILPVVYMIGVLLLVLPAFLQSNSKLKQFLTNLTIWIIVVLIILTIIYIFKKWVKIYYNILILIKINPRRIPVNGKMALAQFDLRLISNGPKPNPGTWTKSLVFINFFRMTFEIHALKKTRTYRVPNPLIYI